MNRVRLIDGIVEWCQSYEWPDWRITETLRRRKNNGLLQ